jgi:hypothetical protein
VEAPVAGCWRLWVRLRSLLRPRRGLEVGTFRPSGEVTETEGDGRVSNIDCYASTFIAASQSGAVFDVPGEVAASGQQRHAAGCGRYSSTNNLFQTGGMFGRANDQNSSISGTRSWFACPGGGVAGRSATLLLNSVCSSGIS